MSLINYSRYKYTPDEMNEGDFLKRFVVRDDEFNEVFDDIKNSDYSVPTQHYIIIGQRGQGKTTLLRKLHIEIAQDKELSKFLVPVKFAEEQYQIRDLCRLWEEVADYLQTIYENEFDGVLDRMEEHFEDYDYDLQCFSYLEKELKEKGKKVILLVDNIDELLGKLKEKEQRRLREILVESNSFRIIGGSTKMLEQHFDYGKPFYEFFKIVKLQGLNKEESLTFLRAIGEGEQKEKIEKIIQNEPARIETLRRLTGGVPRTLVMLFDIFLDDGGNAFDDLLKILDEATPLYKHRMDDLPPVLQDIVHAMAINWDGMYAKEIAKKTRLESKVVSAQLKQLERKYGIVESEAVGKKNKIYKIQERFFNIWYLMRFGRKKDRQRVEWLVKFLESWCTPNELEQRSKKLIENIKDGSVSESYAYHMSEALGYCGINFELEQEMKDVTKKYLESVNSEFVKDMTKSDTEILLEFMLLDLDQDYDLSLKMLEKIKYNTKEIEEFKQRTLENQKNYRELWKPLLLDDEKKLVSKYKNKYVWSTLLIGRERFEESVTVFLEIVDYCYMENIEIDFSIYFMLLLGKGQTYKLKELFENEKYNFKEKSKVIWYAIISLFKEEYADEVKKMGTELVNTVEEVLMKSDKITKYYYE